MCNPFWDKVTSQMYMPSEYRQQHALAADTVVQQFKQDVCQAVADHLCLASADGTRQSDL